MATSPAKYESVTPGGPGDWPEPIGTAWGALFTLVNPGFGLGCAYCEGERKEDFVLWDEV
jgi:hypothetical protein